MSYPWIHESEMDAARAEAEYGGLSPEEREYQRGLEQTLEADPDYQAWADAKHLDRWGIERPHPEAEAEAEL